MKMYQALKTSDGKNNSDIAMKKMRKKMLKSDKLVL